MKLEEVARSSSTAARTAVAPLDPPPIGESPRGRAVRPALATAAVTVVLVGGLLMVNRGQNETEPVTEPVSVPAEVEVPRLGIVSENWVPVFATDGSEEEGLEVQRFDYYGDASAARPFESDDLLVAWGDMGELFDGEPVTVRAVDGVVATGDTVGFDADVTTLTWRDPAGPWILLASRHADSGRLIEIAEALAVDTTAGPLEESIPLDRVASDFGTPFMAMRGAQAEASSVVYEAADDAAVSLVVTARRGDVGEAVTAAEWWIGAPTEVDLVAGTGYEFDLGSLLGDGEGTIIIWSPARHAIAQLLRTGPATDADLALLVQDVMVVDDAAWAELLQSEGAPDTDAASFDVLFGEGGGEIDGAAYAWAFGDLDGQLCVNVSTGGGGAGSCQDMPTELPDGTVAAAIDQGTIDQLATWVILADSSVGSIQVDDAAGVTIERVEANGWSWFVAIGPAGPAPTFAVVSTDGDVIGSVEDGVRSEEAPSAPGSDPAIAGNPSATELGIDDMAVLLSVEDGDLAYWFGIDEGQPCIVTGGDAVSAGCAAPGDIVVFPPIELADGERTFAVLTDLPDCVSGTSVEGDISGTSSVTDGAEHQYELIVGSGSAADWEFGLMVGSETVILPLPPEGTMPYPPDLCS